MKFTITQLVASIKAILEDQSQLQNVSVVGEISNLVKHRSGHWYFSLKDNTARINCVMFQSSNKSVGFEVKDGQQVVVKAVTTVYLGSGQLQLVCSTMSLDGEGLLYQEFLKLRDKLHKEGLFDPKFKKTITRYPQSLGIVAGHKSAALADVLKTIQMRWPMTKTKVYESLVQGHKASENIIEQLKQADSDQHDTILLVRGGGSLEDLAAFNDESLARFIFRMSTPIITGVGHEIDVTLVDYVSDLRAVTPTAAAQAATSDQSEVLSEISNLHHQLLRRLDRIVTRYRNKYHLLNSHKYFQTPNLILHESSLRLRDYDQKLLSYTKRFNRLSQLINDEMHRLQHKLHRKLQIEVLKNDKLNQQIHFLQMRNYQKITQSINLLIHQLDDRSPLKLMKKGFVTTTQQNQRLTSIHQVNIYENLSIQYIDGKVTTQVIQLERDSTYE